ncbi:PP2C family protein-serine/threonine phosphatase [Streptomyces sp. ME109]|uniref:PP2C family protein-serine/threonine phosphatase n=1 Tax=Streptomyces sp. me109 TaxID=1827853 RepID=UPI0021C86BEA|nr:PP2C family protein-serine/threonine phosphatase [Streptomyces sp. me109]
MQEIVRRHTAVAAAGAGRKVLRQRFDVVPLAHTKGCLAGGWRTTARPWRAGELLETAFGVALVLAIAVIGFIVPGNIHMASLLVTAPALMATVSAAWPTGVVAALALPAVVVADVHDGLLDSPVLDLHVATLLVVSLLLVAVCRARGRCTPEAHCLRTVSKAAQRVILRPLPRQIADLRVASVYRAAEAMAEVGGDLYAAARTPYGTRLVIGDVKGKGLRALDDTAALLGAFREAAHQHPTLPGLAAALDSSVRRHVAEAGEQDADAPERFITALLVEFPADGGPMRTVNCGHPLPLRMRDGSVTALSGRTPALPLGLGTADPYAYQQDSFVYAPYDVFLLYTDGLSEARDRSGAFYSVTERGIPWHIADGDPEAVLRQIMADVLHHTTGRLDDDVALVAVQCVPPSS